MNSRALIRSFLLALVLASCAHSLRPFPLAEPMRVDGDRRPFSPRPADYFSGFAWDGADQMVFRPVADFFAVDPPGEAINVNAMDEVPDSSWFQNRLGRRTLTEAEILRAACSDAPIDPAGPWTISAAKPNGANPGFIIEDAEGRNYLLKFDTVTEQPERATSADVIGSILYWAAGYNAPCNRVVFFDESVLTIGEDTTIEIDGADVPLNDGHIAPVFENALRLEDGRLRATSSQFLPGRPIGPWRYEGTQSDDPNDVVPHEERRELRGGYVLAAWLNHFDSREQNTLAIWHDEDGVNGYVEHFYIDFGDTLGSIWPIEGITRRLGHSAYFDAGHVFQDFLTLGLIPRPWNQVRTDDVSPTFGYFDSYRFDPDSWRPGYANPAFDRASERDKAWMARIIAELRPSDIAAIIRQAHFAAPETSENLYRILMQRRQLILSRYFQKLSPLTRPRIEEREDGARVCLDDLAVQAGLQASESRPYYSQSWSLEDENLIAHGPGTMTRRLPATVCTTFPALDVSDGEARYAIVDVAGLTSTHDTQSMPARVHLYRRPDGVHQIVGLERPDSRRAP
ncbi:MAG: hypothetical protein AB8H86_08980 [Polyangiales bacterium]